MRHLHHHHHHHLRRRWWRANPLAYVRMRLHRRLFVMIGFSMFLSAMAAVATVHLTSEGSPWNQETARLEDTVVGELARVWDTPAERDALAARMAHSLTAQIELDDPQGTVLMRAGAACQEPMLRAPVLQGGQRVGTFIACAERFRPRPWHWALPLFAISLVLWISAGRLARRMLRPLSMAVEVAEALGAGKLDARADLGCYRFGEERVLAESLNRMADRIQRQMSDQRELLAAVSHELRTPLGHLRLLTEMARDTGATTKTFDELDREVSEIDCLVGDLLANSRLNFTALTPLPLDGADLARRALDRAGLEPTLLAVEGDAHFSGDATLLSRALANLLDNARSHGGGAAALRVRRDGPALAFEVDDRGPGFAPGDEKRAFEPFFQRTHGASGNGDAGSLGLGLALVRRIAEAHGGTAQIANRPEGGARVSFSVSAAAAATAAA